MPATTPEAHSGLSHHRVGAGEPLLLVHPTWRAWLPVIPALSARHDVVSVDLPGFGEASPEEGEQAPWTDVIATMDELGTERAALVGNSFGGAVALRVAVLAPARVSKLVLISAPAPELEPSEQLQAAWAEEEAALDALESDHRFLLDGDVFTPGLIEAYTRYKREEEVDAIRMRPHPWEFALYHDA